tara:strand:+ start:11878 stop:12948 length:1071 start_codon:yes stop_codon:yes gene_type:complete
MMIYKWMQLTALTAALALPLGAVATEFADVLDTPAVASELAAHSMLTGLALAGERTVAVGQRGHILYSDDAGEHWQQATVPVSADLVAVHFPTSQQGWAVGHGGVVLHSSDAGQTWSRQLDGRQVGPLMLAYYQQQAAAQPDDPALAALVNEAQRMTDEGADKPFLDVWFENDQVGYIVGAFNLIFRTADGGQNWTPWLERTDNPSALNLYAINVVGNDLFIVGEQGLILKLDPLTERFEATSTPYRGTFFGITGKPGVALAFGLRGNAYRSVDAGVSWQPVELGLTLSITTGTVAADGRIILVSQAGHVLISHDDALSFQPLAKNHLTPVAAARTNGPDALTLVGMRGVRVLPIK